jgi:hypothetical protein
VFNLPIKNTIASEGGYELRPLRCWFVLFANTAALAQSNPVPLVNQPLVPTAIAPGGQSFKLTKIVRVSSTGMARR